MEYIDSVLRAYLACAVWTALDEDGNPAPADAEIQPEDEAVARAVCLQFVADAGSLLFTAEPWASDPEQVGHDLWLTRNHHGAGFWDRGAGEAGEALTVVAHAVGEQDVTYEDGALVWL
jgi:hypothetical protein